MHMRSQLAAILVYSICAALFLGVILQRSALPGADLTLRADFTIEPSTVVSVVNYETVLSFMAEPYRVAG